MPVTTKLPVWQGSDDLGLSCGRAQAERDRTDGVTRTEAELDRLILADARAQRVRQTREPFCAAWRTGYWEEGS